MLTGHWGLGVLDEARDLDADCVTKGLATTWPRLESIIGGEIVLEDARFVLSAREYETLEGHLAGCSNAHIAGVRKCSEKTVSNQLAMAKSKVEAAGYAVATSRTLRKNR